MNIKTFEYLLSLLLLIKLRNKQINQQNNECIMNLFNGVKNSINIIVTTISTIVWTYLYLQINNNEIII